MRPSCWGQKTDSEKSPPPLCIAQHRSVAIVPLGHGVSFLHRSCMKRRGSRRWRDRSTGVHHLRIERRWVRTSWKVTSSCQRSTNHSRIWVGSAAGSVPEQGLSGEGALGVSNQHPANEDGRLAGAVPDRRLGGEFHGAGDAVVPGHLGAGPSYIRLLKENFQRRPPRPFNGGRPFWPG